MEANGLTRRSKNEFRVNFLPRGQRYQPSEHWRSRQQAKKASLGRHVRKAKWNTPNCESGAIVQMPLVPMVVKDSVGSWVDADQSYGSRSRQSSSRNRGAAQAWNAKLIGERAKLVQEVRTCFRKEGWKTSKQELDSARGKMTFNSV